ncbi:MAG: glycosyltransferase family 4 protein [Cytophagaceae bacterium]
MNKKILFISHDASRTGAPILLLNLINWLVVNKGVSAEILIMNGKAWHDKLVPDFSKVGKVYVLNENKISYLERIKRFFLKKIGVPNDSSNTRLVELFKNKKYDFIYANTLVTSTIIPDLSRLLKAPILMHAHELEVVTQRFVGVEVVRAAVPFINKYIIANSLIQRRVFEKFKLNISSEKVSVLPEYVVDKKIKSGTEIDLTGFSGNTDIIVGSGTVDWRKGIDLFIQTAIQYRKIAENNFIFCWIGGETTIELQYELDVAGLGECVKIVNQIPDITPYLECANVFFLSSREDPYPLVSLEAALAGCPIVCFKDSGGMNDFVTEDNGIKVDFIDTFAAAVAIKTIVSDKSLRAKLSLSAKQKAQQHHIDIVAEKIWGLCTTKDFLCNT